MNMTDDEQYTDLDMSDIVDDSVSDHLTESENQNTEFTDSESHTHEADDDLPGEEQVSSEKKTKSEVTKSTRLPLSRIKNIMKTDPDVNLINAEAVFLVTKATELFLETIAKEVYTYSNKKKIISKKDFDHVIDTVDCLCFLEGAMDF